MAVRIAALIMFFALSTVTAAAQNPCRDQRTEIAPPETPVAWDPISCWGCDSTPQMISAVVNGYLIGIPIGLSGILRRRFSRLNPAAIHVLNV